MYEVKVKDLRFALKQVGEAGEFSGLAAVYNVEDLTGDVILPGAFAHSLAYRKGKFPLFWNHQLNEPIGFVHAQDSEAGLLIEGKLNLEVGRAREIHALMRQALADGHPFGLSFGFDTVRSEPKNGKRYLKEVKLWEFSVTLMPANPLAQVLAVKGAAEGKPFGDYADFAECVAANQDKESPEGYCAWLHRQLTGEWPTEKVWHTMEECLAAYQDRDDREDICRALMEQVEARRRVPELLARGLRLTRAQIAELCPSCAKKMEQLHLTALVLNTETVKQMPEQLLAGLCRKFGAEEGFFTRCVDGISLDAIDDPYAFCAWLHHECTGLWPAEGESKALAGAHHALGEVERLLRGQGAASAADQARELKATVGALAKADSADARKQIIGAWEAISALRQLVRR